MQRTRLGRQLGPVLSLVWGEERGAMIIVALLVMTVLATLGMTAIMTTTIESDITGYHRTSVQAFYAAETGAQVGINQLSARIPDATQVIPSTDLDAAATYQYRSGSLSDATPQPLQFTGARNRAGYALNSGTWYNPSGHVFYVYQINTTGTGPRNSQREIEMRASYGPVQR